MAVIDVLVILIIALLVVAIFALAFGRAGPWTEDVGWGLGLAMFFLLIFLAAWGGSIWVGPVGPVFYGTYWLAPLIIALIVAMLLAAAPRSSQARRALETEERGGVGTAVDTALIVFFWITLVLLIGVVLLGLFA